MNRRICPHSFPRDRSLRQFWKKWRICLDHPGVSSGIGVWLFTATTDSILRLTRAPLLNASCGWFYPATNSSSGGWIRVAAVSSPGGWIRVTTEVEFWQLDITYGWVEFRRLDTSCSWFYPAANSSSRGWIQVTADSILRLTRAPAPGSDLRLIPSCGWLEFLQLDRSYSWHIIQLIRVHIIQLTQWLDMT